jgi:hypothetical protein
MKNEQEITEALRRATDNGALFGMQALQKGILDIQKNAKGILDVEVLNEFMRKYIELTIKEINR